MLMIAWTKEDLNGFIRFYSILIIKGYLMLSLIYTYILNIQNLVWFRFLAY